MTGSDSICPNSTSQDRSGMRVSPYEDLGSKTLSGLLSQKPKLPEAPLQGDASQSIESTKTPIVQNVWMKPLSESTPVDIPQPRDRLRVKPRLSKLSEYVQTRDDNEEEEDNGDEDNSEDDHSGKVQDHEETPSKPQRTPPLLVAQKQLELQAQVDDLKKFKDFVGKLENGATIIDLFNSTEDSDIIILNKQDLLDSKNETEVLKTQNESQLRASQTLKEQIDSTKLLNKDLKENISLKESSYEALKEHTCQLESQLKLEEEKLKKTEGLLQELKETLDKTRGDETTIISTKRFPSLGELNQDKVTLYDELELSFVDRLSQIEAQNLIKNILVNLHIPFGKTQENIYGIVNMIGSKEVLSEFANKTHRLFYQSDINLSVPQQKANNNHLEQCTTKMFMNIEFLYKTLKRN